MKTTSNRTDRFMLILAVCCGLFGFTFNTLRAEGSGVGGGNLPPPKAIINTSASLPAGSILLSNGSVMLPNGMIVTY